MSYFNHAFVKTMVGVNRLSPGTAGFTEKNKGVLGTAGNILSAGQFAFVNPKDWKIQDTVYAGQACCPLILAAGSLYTKDKIGPFHGGYLESNKSKAINPKYISKFYFAPACPASNNVIHLGFTPYTDDQVLTLTFTGGANITDGVYSDVAFSGGSGTGFKAKLTVVGGVVTTVEIVNGGTGYTAGNVLTAVAGQLIHNGTGVITQPTVTISTVGANTACKKDFLCGETYNLRLDVKGSPALRFLNHNAYLTVSAYTGCCPTGSITPTVVDGTEVYIKWAQQIVDSPLISPFIYPVVIAENNTVWFKPGTNLAGAAVPAGYTLGGTWDKYVSPGHVVGQYAGIILYGAYVDTKFGDCSFQVSDFYEKEPVRLYASEVDLNGDPCAFNGLCVVTECQGRQANGLGETVLRDVILSERYSQNFFHSDFRIREITQGSQILSNVIDRDASYNRFYIQHHVPRFNNPTSTFDNDQYLLEIVVSNTTTPTDGAKGQEFATFVNAWIAGCGSNCVPLETQACGATCVPVVTLPTTI